MEQISITTFKIEDIFTPGIIKMIRAQDKMDSRLVSMDKRMGSTVNSMKSKMQGFIQGNSMMISQLSNQIPMLGGNLAMLANPYAAAAAGAVALGAAYVSAVGDAKEWHKGMALVNVTAGLSKPALAGLSDQILEVGKKSRGADLMAVPEAFNTIISAGLDVKTSLNALNPTLIASKAGFTDIKVAANAAVSVMNSAGIADATRVYDVLFQTMKDGKAEFQDIAQYLPKIIPSALAAGFSLEQTAGAYSFLTAQGQTAERATTLLENSFKALSDPSKIKKFKAIGVSLYDTQGKMQPLVKIAEQLNTKLNGLTDIKRSSILSSLGLDMEAKGGLLALSQDAGKLQEITDNVTNSQGALNQAYIDSGESGDVWVEVMNRGKAAMISIGETGLPIWQRMGEGVLSLITRTQELYNNNLILRDGISMIGTVFEVAFNMAMRPIRIISRLISMAGEALDFLAGRLGFVGGGFSQLYHEIRPYLLWIWEVISKIADIGYKLTVMDFKGAVNSFKNFELPDMDKMRKQTNDQYVKKDKTVMEGLIDPVVTPKKSSINSVISGAGGIPESGKSGSGSGRNVTVQINKLVEKIEIHVVQAGRDSYRDMERTITEVLTKAVRDSEIALSSD